MIGRPTPLIRASRTFSPRGGEKDLGVLSHRDPSPRLRGEGARSADEGRAYELIVIGCSLGGMHALEAILGTLPDDFGVPVAVVQHRHKASNEGLPAYLRKGSKLNVVDVEDKLWIEPGKVYLAPANYHLLVERGVFDLSVDDAVSYSRPSVDVLFESAADAYGETLVGVVLTGSNRDGARGAKRIKQRGGFLVVQDPLTSEAPEMPRAAIEAAQVDRILPLAEIGPFLIELCRSPDL